MLDAILPYIWLVVLVLSIIFYKLVLRLFGIYIISEDSIGILSKKFVLFGKFKTLPEGRIIALRGEAGYQADTLPPGIYFWFWPWQYSIEMHKLTVIEEGMIGLIMARDGNAIPNERILGENVECDNFQSARSFLENKGQKGRQSAYITAGTYRINTALFEVHQVPMVQIEQDGVGIVRTLDGSPLPAEQIAGPQIVGHNNFQDADSFLRKGGNRGLQTQVLLAGSWNINPWFAEVINMKMTIVPIGFVGVVISYVGPDGEDTSGTDFKHGNIVNKGFKGVWKETLNPGKYPINTSTNKVELVPTTNLVLNWANSKNEAHNLDQKLCTITVRSKDGFHFNLDVSQIIHVPSYDAPMVIARFGSIANLVSQVLEPTIGNYFRNSAQSSEMKAFLSTREERQKDAKEQIQKALEGYNIQAVDTLIGDIVPPEELMKTLTEKKLAEERQSMYETQELAEKQRQALENAKSVADMQGVIVKAEQNVQIALKEAESAVNKAEGEAKTVKLAAQAEAERIKLTGEAEAKKILAIGEATAEAYRKQVEAMGPENFAALKVIEQIANGQIKITPDILIQGKDGGGSTVDALLALVLKDHKALNIENKE